MPTNAAIVPSNSEQTFTIPTPNETGQHSYPGVGPHTSEEKETQAVYHSYYQWVPLILLLQGMAFFVPRLLWYKLEDGTVKGLRMELNLPYLDTDKQAIETSKFWKTRLIFHR